MQSESWKGNSLTLTGGHVGLVRPEGVTAVFVSCSLEGTVIITGNAAILRCLCDGLTLVGSQECWKGEGGLQQAQGFLLFILSQLTHCKAHTPHWE